MSLGHQRLPVDLDTVDGRRGHGGDDRLVLGPVLAQQRDRHGVGTAVGYLDQGLLAEGGQGPVRADFEERGHAEPSQLANAVREPDGVTGVPHPVPG